MTRRLLLLLLALPTTAAAHPLGNFTINHWASLHVAAGRLEVRYVVDMAEIPAFREITAIDTDGNGTIDSAERAAYLGRMSETLADGLRLEVDGTRVALAPEGATLELPPGVAGLSTLRLEARFTAPLAVAAGAIAFRDDNFAGRPGWREIVADAGDGASIAETSVPSSDRSAALRAYPADLLEAPLDVREAHLRVGPGGTALTPQAAAGTRTGAARFGDRLTALLGTTAPLDPRVILTALGLAIVLGALHALSPGHGKAVVGAYLVGAHGTTRDALVLGLVVTATHTLGVYVLGLATLAASHWIVPDRLFPWLGVSSGLLVLGIGSSLATSRLTTALGAGSDHHHHGPAHDHHHHHHGPGGHVHEFDLTPGDAPTWRGLLALGVSGGILPCPSALVVMLGAIALGRIAFGLGLIAAFSVGLAAVLTGIGLLFVHARRLLERLPVDGALTRWAPVASAAVIALVGVVMVARGLAQAGVVGGMS